MRIHLPAHIGFCFGVRRAIEVVEAQLEKNTDSVYCLGDLIHNPGVMDKLASKGLCVVRALNEVSSGTVFTRAHGVDPAILQEGEERGLRMIETTCPYVRRVQELARSLAEQSYHLVVVGSSDHPEVKGVIAAARTSSYTVVETEQDLEQLPREGKLGVVVQTTESLDNLRNIVKNLIDNHLELRLFNTICQVVLDRRAETVEMSREVGAMVVLGGRQSSNTRQIAELCHSQSVVTFLVERAEELDLNSIKHHGIIGLTGGTSTPASAIKDLRKKLAVSRL